MLMGILYALVVFLAFSFIIIIHELGHFLAGKFFKVRIEVFSVGMGKRLWGFKRGDTDYRISMFPLGGYVAFAGISDTEGDISTGAPDEFPSKPFWQRIIIAAAGPIMNLISGYLLAVLLFAFGVQFTSPIVGSVSPGSPAAEAKLQPGDRILKINGTIVNGFSDIKQETALSDPGDLMTLIIKRGDQTIETSVTTRQDEGQPFPSIGIDPLVSRKLMVNEMPHMIEAGFENDDELISVNGIEINELHALQTVQEVIYQNPGKEVTFKVLRNDNEENIVIVPELAHHYFIDFAGLMNAIDSVDGPAKEAGIQAGDYIVAVNGEKLTSWNDIRPVVTNSEGELTVTVWRAGETLDLKLTPQLKEDENGKRKVLGVVTNSMSERPVLVTWVQEGSVAEEAGLKAGMELKSFSQDLQGKVKITLTDDRVFTFDAKRDDSSAPFGHFVFGNLTYKQEIVKASGIGEAFTRGYTDCKQIVNKTYLFLAKLVSAKLSPTLMSGPVGIVHISYKVLTVGVTVFLHFLVLISINLAVVNLLPLPIVDGGNIILLLVEGIKGSPVSQKMQTVIIYAGLVIIGGVFLMATFNDVYRLIFGF